MALGKRLTKARDSVGAFGTVYPLEEAVRLVKGNATAKFDETIEIAMNLGIDPRHADQAVRGVVQMPNGTGKTVRIGVFAKGEKADRLIIVGLQQGELNTIYRMRALLANMTTMSRLSPFFQERTVAEDATFFDLLKLLGFRELTITDGEKTTLQVTIK